MALPSRHVQKLIYESLVTCRSPTHLMSSRAPVLSNKIDTPSFPFSCASCFASICLFRSATFCIFHGLYHLPPCLVLVLARSRYPSYYRLSIVSSLYSNTSPDVLLAVCNTPPPFRTDEHDSTIEYRRVFVSGCETGYERLAGETPRLVKTR